MPAEAFRSSQPALPPCNASHEKNLIIAENAAECVLKRLMAVFLLLRESPGGLPVISQLEKA